MLERLLDLLDVRLDAFAMCEIEKGHGLKCQPLDMIVVHFVLKGEGAVECEHGTYPLRPGTILVVPRHLPKIIMGSGPVARLVDAAPGCAPPGEMLKFRAGGGDAGLVLGCASVTATVGDGFGLFDHLRAPLAEQALEPSLTPIFHGISSELADPRLGTRAIVGALMKHILIVLLRTHLSRSGPESPLYTPLLNPQLGKAMLAIVSKPEAPHCVDSLAVIAGMSRSRFAHHFTITYGRSPMDFVQSVRLRTAMGLLRTSDLPIKSIAAAVGYASRSHFSRAFRAEYGLDPTSFRMRNDEAEPALGGATPSLAIVPAAS